MRNILNTVALCGDALSDAANYKSRLAAAENAISVPRLETGAEGLLACPRCDALYKAFDLDDTAIASCRRCGHVLAAPRKDAARTVFALSLGSLILLLAAAPLPLLSVSVAGATRTLSLANLLTRDAGDLAIIFRFAGILALLLPLSRDFLLILAMWPILTNRTAGKTARASFRRADILRVWSMSEIFVLGCAISLIELSAIATVKLGSGFWLLIAACSLTVVQQRVHCRHTLWMALER